MKNIEIGSFVKAISCMAEEKNGLYGVVTHMPRPDWIVVDFGNYERAVCTVVEEVKSVKK